MAATITGSGTTAIELALRYRIAGRTGRLCLMPAYTFVATAHAAVNVGLEPFFARCRSRDAGADAGHCRPGPGGGWGEVAAVVVVSPYGAPIDVAAWEAFEAAHGIPVVFDAAAATLNLHRVGAQPICVSLHATKALGIGEGGAILTTDTDLVAQTTAMTGFGFSASSRVSEVRGGNYRISEYRRRGRTGGVRRLEARIQQLRDASLAYVAGFERIGVRMQPGFGRDWLTMTITALFEPGTADAVTAGFDVGDPVAALVRDRLSSAPRLRDLPARRAGGTAAAAASAIGCRSSRRSRRRRSMRSAAAWRSLAAR